MYTLSKGPNNKLSMSARRGPPRQLEFEGYYTREKSTNSNGEGYFYDHQTADMSNPKPTFQSKKPVNKWRLSQYSQNPALHENHLEMANLLCKQWKKVMDRCQKGSVEDMTYVFYSESEPNKSLSGVNNQVADRLSRTR
ncbi:unnamed protein product [Candidula unifasciata]|uniref:Uncharacterized protein n=1 Tax=Candidula unifasciata TaxID=100452 RepID=A0A8S3ZJ52_9EUPU|nr:unnamed protein product [Candidula unifasciata]